MAGVHPYIKLLDEGADVIIGGRSSDCAIFAAPAMRRGFPEGLAYFYGKVLECASFCAEPYGGKESVLGEITMDDVKVTAMLPGAALHDRLGRRPCDVRAGQPVLRAFPRRPHRHEPSAVTSNMTSAPPASPDPNTFRRPNCASSSKARARSASAMSASSACATLTRSRNIDVVIAWARQQVVERFGDSGYELHYTVYGRDAILGDAASRCRRSPAHELVHRRAGDCADARRWPRRCA